jgi:hypothetical protein
MTRGCEVKEIPIVEKLEEEATALQRAAWSRPDGGADACIASNLATEAAAIIKELVEALKAADDGLRDHACHGGPAVPCLRSATECSIECGKRAGNALLKVTAALTRVQVESSDE